jgi:multiple sugar transport system ATP-binding protein
MADLRLEKVNKFYNKDVHAVIDSSFYCNDKEFLAILGPSGCGKSSTLRMIAGLEDVDSGDIYIGERKVTGLHPNKRNIGLAFENYALYPHLSVYENIVFPLRVRGYTDEELEKMGFLDELIETFHIQDIINNYPKKLSGGQAQLVSLVRCLIKDVDLYLLDEPLSHLDEEMKVNMRTMLKMMHDKMNKTFIYVTHDQLEAFSLADRVVIMNIGVIQQIGTPEEIYENPSNKFVASFVGEPPMNFLNVEVKREGNQFFLCGDSYQIPVPEDSVSKLIENRKYILGIRPERITVSKSKSEQTPIQAKVAVFENLGEINQITIELDGDLIITETEPDFRFTMDDVIYLGFDSKRIHIFDPETEGAVI